MDQKVNIEWAEERSGSLRGSNAFVYRVTKTATWIEKTIHADG